MSWGKVKLGDFLNVRENRFKPSDLAIAKLKRIDKIDFSGVIFISDKPSNTDMILVKKGDLVISGINVEKGAMCVYQGDEDITATIHYSSYQFDKNKISVDFLKYFLKSLEFKKALKEQVPGGIKTEIKPKHLLSLIVLIPTDIKEQKAVVKILQDRNYKVNLIDSELTYQLDIIKKLRQQFLQDAIQGKLVSQKENEESASELYKKIEVDSAKIKKGKKFLPIKDEEVAFDIPYNWKWCRFGDIALNISTGPFGTMLHQSDYVQNQIPLVNPMNIVNERIVPSSKMTINQETKKRLSNYVLKTGDIVLGRRGEMGRCAIVTEQENGWLCGTGSFFIELHPSINREYFVKVIGSDYAKSYLLGSSVGSTMNNLNHKILNSFLVPLPPLFEQLRIVQKLRQVMHACDQLEVSIRHGKERNERLLQQVLREALRNPKENIHQ